jgi:hypothetical protein
LNIGEGRLVFAVPVLVVVLVVVPVVVVLFVAFVPVLLLFSIPEVEPDCRLLVVELLLPRDEPVNASPLDVPEAEEPDVWPAVGVREEPVKASPDEVPEIDVPEVLPPVPCAPTVAAGREVVVAVVAFPGLGRTPDVWAWTAVPARAIATDVAMNAGVNVVRIEVSLDRISG